jgi:hypothetical protein
LGNVGDHLGGEEAGAYRQASRQLDAEDHRLGDAVDDGADDDAHRPARALVPEALLDDAVSEKEHGDAGEHPQAQLPLIEALGLGDQIEGDRRQHRPRAEPGEHADDPPGDGDPADDEPGEQERRLRKRTEPERVEHGDQNPGRRSGEIRRLTPMTIRTAG